MQFIPNVLKFDQLYNLPTVCHNAARQLQSHHCLSSLPISHPGVVHSHPLYAYMGTVSSMLSISPYRAEYPLCHLSGCKEEEEMRVRILR